MCYWLCVDDPVDFGCEGDSDETGSKTGRPNKCSGNTVTMLFTDLKAKFTLTYVWGQ